MITAPDSLRVQVDLVDNHPRVTIAAESAGDKAQEPIRRKKRKKTSALVIPRGSLSVKIYPVKNGRYRHHVLVYYEAGQRRREVRASLGEAQALADTVLTRLARGEALSKNFSPADVASFLRSRELAVATGKPVELVVAQHAEFERKLKELGISLDELIKFYLDNRPKDFKRLPLSELVEQFLAQKKAEISAKWHRSLSFSLERVAAYFNPQDLAAGQSAGGAPALEGQAPVTDCRIALHQLGSAELNGFLRALNVGGRSRHNYRAAIDQLVRWSKANGHLPKAWSEMDDVQDPGARPGEIRILTPEQVTSLLGARQHMEEVGKARGRLIPLIAVMAFAGVRHAEAARLDWRDICIQERYIYIRKDVSKTGNDRIVPLSDNLAAWLLPHAKPNGKICEMLNSPDALVDAKQKAGLPAGKNETRNSLRKTWISSRLGVTQSINQVAEEAGNSPAMIRANYKRPVTQREGARLFNIWPTSAEIVQMNFGFK